MQRLDYKRKQARELRRQGNSIRSIARILQISTSTASLWCQGVQLSLEQKRLLSRRGANHDLLRGYAAKRHQDKVVRWKALVDKSRSEIKGINKDQFFLIGIALYWAEGFKNVDEGRLGFCNSDPKMIKLMIVWFRQMLNLNDSSFTLRVEFNVSHKDRTDEIEKYWSRITGVPVSQFNKPYLQKANGAKEYKNRGDYYGLLRIRIRRSSALLQKMRGWIAGLSQAY